MSLLPCVIYLSMPNLFVQVSTKKLVILITEAKQSLKLSWSTFSPSHENVNLYRTSQLMNKKSNNVIISSWTSGYVCLFTRKESTCVCTTSTKKSCLTLLSSLLEKWQSSRNWQLISYARNFSVPFLYALTFLYKHANCLILLISALFSCPMI